MDERENAKAMIDDALVRLKLAKAIADEAWEMVTCALDILCKQTATVGGPCE